MHVCGKGERERQSASRERRTGEDEVRGKQARARKRVKGTGHHKDGENEKKKNALQSNGRLFDALPLVVVRVLVGDGDDVLFSSPLPFSHCISLSLSFALHATSGLSSHTTLPILLTTTRFFFAVLLFFSLQKDQRQRHTM